MKFAHISDLHLGKRVHQFSMIEDQNYILDKIVELVVQEEVDGVFIAGDIYDKVYPFCRLCIRRSCAKSY